MRRLFILVLAGALAALILLPVTATVNPTVGKAAWVAEGDPIPPIPPKAKLSVGNLRAEGDPIPPIPPKRLVLASLA
jgi:hypothetical protein